MFQKMTPHSINTNVLVRAVFCAIFAVLASWMHCHTAGAGNLNAGGQWSYSDSSMGSADSQKYYISYYGRADVTDRILLNGSFRYNKDIATAGDTDSAGSAIGLVNSNELYRFALNGSYNYSTRQKGAESQSWNWTGRLDNSWTDSLWPSLNLLFSQSGSNTDGVRNPVSNSARLDTGWNYFEWLTLGYDFSWSKSEAADNSSSSQNLNHSANLKISRSYWKNRGSFSFTQLYNQQESRSTSRITGAGFGLVPVPVSQLYFQEIQDPSDNVLTNDGSYLFTDEQPPVTLTIDPNKEPMNLILFTASQDMEVVRLYSTNDIENFYQGITWRAYQSPTGTDSWNLVGSGILGVGDYDQTEQRITIDLGTEINSEYVKLVIELPDPVLDVPPGEITYLEGVEVFRKVFGSGTSVTDTTGTESWISGLVMDFRLTNTVRLSYNGKYDLRQGSNTKERRSLGNSGGISWTPNEMFRAQATLTENRLDVEEQEEFINRSYNLSLASELLATLHLSGALQRSESLTGSTLQTATNVYSIQADAQLYRDLSGSLYFSYSNPQTGGGSDSMSAILQATARLSPVLLLNWTSNNNIVPDTNALTMSNDFFLNWRTSALMNMSSSLNTKYARGEDFTSRLSLNVGITPNKRNRIGMGYTIADEEEIKQSITAGWQWIISRTFDLNLSGNYYLAEENSWSVGGTLKASFANL